DTTAGFVTAQAMAAHLGIKLISGVEISCHHRLMGGYGKHASIDKIIHVVALNCLDIETLQQALSHIQHSRAHRGRQMVENMAQILTQKMNLAMTADELWQLVLAQVGGNEQAVGRAHIAQVLYEVGAVKTVQQAFDKYLADGKSAYVALESLKMAQAIQLIHQCGGFAVLAHPTRYNLSATRVRRLVEEFAQLGGDACELPAIAEPASTRAMIDRSIAQHGLLVSVGSDFHGTNIPWRKLGQVATLNKEQVGIWTKFDFVA
ncbi:MAG: PHP domain-containing protein, partial [Moraxella sp.]|nr:PHP domain-containing protein [Moraxella sp.]